jgi:NAD-dependent dihydropyrimidine dehydrogenase PreA subunit
MGIALMPILIDEKTCLDGCTICDFFCPGDIIYREEKEKPAEVRYQDECWYCGICEDRCPVDAVKVVFPPGMVHCTTPPEDYMGLGVTGGAS